MRVDETNKFRGGKETVDRDYTPTKNPPTIGYKLQIKYPIEWKRDAHLFRHPPSQPLHLDSSSSFERSYTLLDLPTKSKLNPKTFVSIEHN